MDEEDDVFHKQMFIQVTRLALAISILRQKPINISTINFTKNVQALFLARQNDREEQTVMLNNKILNLQQRLFIQTDLKDSFIPLSFQSSDNLSHQLFQSQQSSADLFSQNQDIAEYDGDDLVSILSGHAQFMLTLKQLGSDEDSQVTFEGAEVVLLTVKKVFRQFFLATNSCSPQSLPTISLISQQLSMAITSCFAHLSHPTILAASCDEFTQLYTTATLLYSTLSLQCHSFLLDLAEHLGNKKHPRCSTCFFNHSHQPTSSVTNQSSSFLIVKHLVPALIQGPLLSLATNKAVIDPSDSIHGCELTQSEWWIGEQLGFLILILLRLLSSTSCSCSSQSESSTQFLLNQIVADRLCSILDTCIDKLEPLLGASVLHSFLLLRNHIGASVKWW